MVLKVVGQFIIHIDGTFDFVLDAADFSFTINVLQVEFHGVEFVIA